MAIAPADDAQHEAEGNHQHVDEHQLLEQRRVQKGQREVAAEQGREPAAEGECAGSGKDDQQHRGADRRGHAERSGRDRPVARGRVPAVGLTVEQVVVQVGRGRRRAERRHREQAAQPGVGVVDPAGEYDRRQHEAVLQPLDRPQAAHEGAQCASH
jgi:hypothetical protein